MEITSEIDITLLTGAGTQGWENGQNTSVGNFECRTAEGGQLHR